jgi:hypothetical protein
MAAHERRPKPRFDQANDPRRIVECCWCRVGVLATEGQYLELNDTTLAWSAHAHQPGSVLGSRSWIRERLLPEPF